MAQATGGPSTPAAGSAMISTLEQSCQPQLSLLCLEKDARIPLAHSNQLGL